MKYRSGQHKKKGEDDLLQYKFYTSTIQVQFKYNTKEDTKKGDLSQSMGRSRVRSTCCPLRHSSGKGK